jgi:hypothetical protein
MAYYSRNVVIAAVLESTYGTYIAPTAAANGILIGSDWSVTPDIPKIERDVLRAYMGGKETIPGSGSVQVQFTTELASSGTVGTEPAWGPLLKAAGFSGALTTGVKYDYTPISDAFPSLSLSAWFGGVRLNLKGCRVVKVDLDLTVSSIPKATWTIIGIETAAAPTEATTPSPTLTAWKAPFVMTDANAADIRFGTTYTAATGVLTGGTAYPSKGLKLSISTSGGYRAFLGGDAIVITNREITGEATFDLASADRVAFYAACKASTLSSMSWVIGVGAGNILKLFMPSVERNDPTNIDDDGLLLSGYSFRCRPLSGNDELRFVCM